MQREKSIELVKGEKTPNMKKEAKILEQEPKLFTMLFRTMLKLRKQTHHHTRAYVTHRKHLNNTWMRYEPKSKYHNVRVRQYYAQTTTSYDANTSSIPNHIPYAIHCSPLCNRNEHSDKNTISNMCMSINPLRAKTKVGDIG